MALSRPAALSLCFALLVTVFPGGLAGAAPAAQSKPAEVRLTILHTNDVHGELFPFTSPDGKTVGGFARRATLLRRLKDKHPNTLLLDAGDLWERGPLGPLYQGEPEIRAMGLLGYQAMAIGNNEFRAGLPNLRKRIAEARFPVLSANVRAKSTGRYLGKPYTILTAAGLKVGVFGLTAPRVSTYPEAKDVEVGDVTEAAQRMVRELKPKTDFIVALTHIGHPLDLLLGFSVAGIDVIVGGDTHTKLDHPFQVPTTRAGGPGPVIVQAGERGQWVGELNLTLRRGSDGRYRVAAYDGGLHEVGSGLPEDPKVKELLEPYRKKLRRTPAPGSAAPAKK